jgi:hypothetical protein
LKPKLNKETVRKESFSTTENLNYRMDVVETEISFMEDQGKTFSQNVVQNET